MLKIQQLLNLVKFPSIVIGAVGFIKTPLTGSKLNYNQRVDNVSSPFGIWLNQILSSESLTPLQRQGCYCETNETLPEVKNSKPSDWGAFLIFLLEETQQSLENPKGNLVDTIKKRNKIDFILKEVKSFKSLLLESFLQKLEQERKFQNIELPKISLLKKLELILTNKGIQTETYKRNYEKFIPYGGQKIPNQHGEVKPTPSAEKIAKISRVPQNLENHTKVFRLKIPLDRDTVLLIKATKHHFNAVIKTNGENFNLLRAGLQTLAESIVNLGFTSASISLQAATIYNNPQANRRLASNKNNIDADYDNNRGKNGEPHPLKDSKNPFGPLFGGGSLSFFL